MYNHSYKLIQELILNCSRKTKSRERQIHNGVGENCAFENGNIYR